MKTQKKSIVYFHRYPIEYEASQFPVARQLIDLLLKDYQVVYFSMKPIKADYKLREGIKFIEIPLLIDRTNPFDKWFKTILYYFYLPSSIKKLKKINPNFIMAKEPLPLIPSFLARLNKPMFVDASDWWWSVLLGKFSLGRKIAEILESLEIKDWNKQKNLRVISHTKTEAKIIEKKGMNKDRIDIINAPLYKKVYFSYNAKKDRINLGFKNNEFIVTLHGIIHPNKGYDQILEWWKKIIKEHKNWKLLIIGGAGGEKKCRRRIISLGIQDNVIMTGWLPTHEDVNRHLNCSDCLLVTRRNTPENQGIITSSLYHNMMIGKPTLATGLPGMSEIIQHGKNGYLFEPDNYESFKSVLEYIYNNKEKARKVGARGIKRAELCFNPDKAVSLYKKVIDKMLLCQK